MLKRGALVTCREEAELSADDRLLPPELARRGIAASAELWDDPGVDWKAFDAVVLRSTWDYHLRHEEFTRWVEARELDGSRLWNPPGLVRWNSHKFYLRDLEEKGVPIVPTRFLPAGSAPDLGELLARAGWERAVVKPAVSAAAFRTHLVDRRSAESDPARSLLSKSDALFQEYQPEIESDGEWSFVFLGGELSHAVRKRPAPGDFRVQEQFGGSAEAETPAGELVRQAQGAVAAIDSPWLYARVDAVETSRGLMLMELELVEPSLFFSLSPGGSAAARFAGEIEERTEGVRGSSRGR
jgi:glutathione synthase/RimK-type ligase-like ATP-grasp enzyme